MHSICILKSLILNLKQRNVFVLILVLKGARRNSIKLTLQLYFSWFDVLWWRRCKGEKEKVREIVLESVSVQQTISTLSQQCCFDSDLMRMSPWMRWLLSKCRIDETVQEVKLRKFDSLNLMVILCGAHWKMAQLTLIKSSTFPS